MTATCTRDASVAFTIGELDVVVRSDLRSVLDDFAALYPACRRRATGTRPVIRMDVKRDGRTPLGGRRFAVHGDGDKLHADLHADEIIPHLEWGISWRIVATCDQYLQLHAATMARGDRAVVLAGSSGAGKSTLAAALLARGWKYHCDEFALVDPSDLRVHPFPKALCIKAGAFDVIRQLGLRLSQDRHYVKAMKGRVGYISPFDFGAGAIGRPCSIHAVVFPKYTGQDEPRLSPMPRARAAFALAASALNRDVFKERTVSITSRIVRGAKCSGLETGRISETCELIESLID